MRVAILGLVGAIASCGGAGSSDAPARDPAPAVSPRPEKPDVVATDSRQPAGDLEELIRQLPAMLSEAPDDAALAALADRVKAVPGVTGAMLGKPGWAHSITIEPMDAARVAEILGLVDPHIVSTDVHQHSWSIVVRTGDTFVDDHGRRRIPAEPPHYGAWHLRISVAGRPPGPLPGLSWGPSPAYPLAGSGARVTSFSLYPAG
jgi:hypothetical protein